MKRNNISKPPTLLELASAIDNHALYEPDQAHQVLSYGIIEETGEIIDELDQVRVDTIALQGELADGVFYIASIARSADLGGLDGIVNRFLSDFNRLDDMQKWVASSSAFIPEYESIGHRERVKFGKQSSRALAIAALELDTVYTQHKTNPIWSGFDSLARDNMPQYTPAALEKIPDLQTALYNYLGGICLIAVQYDISLDNAMEQKLNFLTHRKRLPHVIENIPVQKKIYSRNNRITGYKLIEKLYERAL